jgi:uncharacterized protein YbjT (DUF2867 family)
MALTPTIFVTGATGNQGGAVARLARSLNWTVHTTTRNPNSEAAKKLNAIGVEITPGSWDDTEGLKTSMTGCSLLFLNSFATFPDSSHEVVQIKGILSIAKDAGVKHVIQSTVFSADKPEKISVWNPDSLIGRVVLAKKAGEEEVRAMGFEAWTILRPGWLMTNLLEPSVKFLGDLQGTNVWASALRADTRLALCDPHGLAKFCIAAFQDPARFNGAQINLASELRTPGELMDALSAASGRKMVAKFWSDAEVEEQLRNNPMWQGQLTMREMEREKKAVKLTYP